MARSEPFKSRRGRLALGATLALALPFGVACNSLIGLSDFEKGQCAGARCTDEGGLIDQFVEGGTDAPQDVVADVRGADPVSWAKWRMPNYVDGGVNQPLPSPPLDIDSGAGIVKDTVTSLVWRSTIAPGEFSSADEAQAACAQLPNGPWRAPKRIELVTLLDYSRPTFIDRTRFTDMKNYKVWSTSEVRPFVAGSPDRAYWIVNFENGAVERLASGGNVAKALCVLAK